MSSGKNGNLRGRPSRAATLLCLMGDRVGGFLRRWATADDPSQDEWLRWMTLGVLFLLGSLIGAISLLLPHPDTFETGALWSNVALSAFAGVILIALAGRLGPWALQVAVLAATVLITRAIYLSGDPNSYYALFYLWAGLYVFFFLGWRWGLLHVAAIGVAFAWVLAELPRATPVASWLMLLVTIAIGAGLIELVVRRLRRVAAESASVARERAELLAKLEHVARTDDLTGLPNRRAWNQELEREVARARREGTPLCIAVIDLDRFKEFNDLHGHQAGDRLLVEICTAWRDRLRATDVLARYGGEEFVVALPDCELQDGRLLMERLRETTPSDDQTCSIGLVQWNGYESPDELLRRADDALYSAKAAGRNRVVTT
jgi:diguanylate cyclase (GGDEF)-like protein